MAVVALHAPFRQFTSNLRLIKKAKTVRHCILFFQAEISDNRSIANIMYPATDARKPAMKP